MYSYSHLAALQPGQRMKNFESSADKNVNPMRGTIVDHDVTHPFESDIYSLYALLIFI